MRVLLVKPLEHPEVVEMEHSLEAMHQILECGIITVSYPWAEPLALVSDDESLLSGKIPSRYVREMEQPIFGSFFLCGISGDDFCDLPEELEKKFMERFWMPELVFVADGKLAVVALHDGTRSGCPGRAKARD